MFKKYSNKKLNLGKETQKKKNTKRSFKKKKLKIRQKIQKSKQKRTKRKKFGGNLEHLSEAGRRHPKIRVELPLLNLNFKEIKKDKRKVETPDLEQNNTENLDFFFKSPLEETNSSEDLGYDDDSSEDCKNYLDDPNSICPAKKKIEYLICLYKQLYKQNKKNKNIAWFKQQFNHILISLGHISSPKYQQEILTLLSNENEILSSLNLGLINTVY